MRTVGPQKMGTSLAGDLVAELVVLLRDIPSGGTVTLEPDLVVGEGGGGLGDDAWLQYICPLKFSV